MPLLALLIVVTIAAVGWHVVDEYRRLNSDMNFWQFCRYYARRRFPRRRK